MNQTHLTSKWINYHHLYYFKTIAEEESVSKAAEKLLLGQPTLSAQLKQFEDALGVQLFERLHKKLILTEQGKIALEYARNIFKLGSEMYEVLNDKVTTSRVNVEIGALDGVPKQITLEIAKLAYQSSSSCHLSLKEGKFDEMMRELQAHRIDLMISNYLPTAMEAKGLHHRILCRNTISLVASSEYKKLKKDFPKSISGQKFVLPTYDSQLRNQIEHWSKLNHIQMDVIAETQDISLKIHMAKSGLGIIPISTKHIQKEISNSELVEIGQLHNVIEEVYLIAAQRKINNPIAAKLMKEINLK